MIPNQAMDVSEVEVSVSDVKKKHVPGLGIAFTMLACFFFALGSIAVKLIEDVGVYTLSLSRFGVQILILLPVVTYRRNDVDILGPDGLRKILWMRGLFGSLCVSTLYLSIKMMDVGDAVTIAFTSTIMLPLLARIFLKEKLTVLEIALCFASMCGVVLIARPAFIFRGSSYKAVNPIGVLIGLIGALCQALSMLTIRKLGKTDAAVNIIYFSGFGCVICIPIIAISEGLSYPCSGDLLFFFSLGVLGIVGQFFLILGLRYERAATVGVARSIQVIIAYIMQVLILGHIPSVMSLIGSGIIFVCCVIIGTTRVIKDRRRNSATK